MTATILVPIVPALPLPPVIVTLVILLFAWWAISREFPVLRDRRVLALVVAIGAAVGLGTPVYAVTVPCDGSWLWCQCVALLICWP